jgi:hypothetical protein
MRLKVLPCIMFLHLRLIRVAWIKALPIDIIHDLSHVKLFIHRPDLAR